MYSQLPLKVRDGIDRRYISSIILFKETAATEERAAMLKKMVFERLNSGGVKLGSQETRNAVYDGPLNRLCLELSENEKFRRMWASRWPRSRREGRRRRSGRDQSTNRPKRASHMFEKMEDVELVLRFFAYRKIGEFKAGLNKISEFLDRFIVAGNKFPDAALAEYRSMFEATVAFLWDVLEGEAFTVLDLFEAATNQDRLRPAHVRREQPRRGASSGQARREEGHAARELKTMYEKNQELFSGRRTNFKDTQDRNRCVSEAFANAIAKTKKK